MRITLLIVPVSLLLSHSLFSQITITNSDMVHAGDSVRVSYALGTNNIDHTQSGPNYTWDFSSLTPYAQQELRYEQPSAIPFTFIATVSHTNDSPDSLAFIGNVPSDLTDQFKGGSSGFREVGFSFSYAPLGNFSVPVIYQNADYIYRFPLTYPNVDTSDADWTLNAQSFGLFYIGETIHRVNHVDGWGTLITPFDTFQCVRVVSVVTTVDTIATDSVTGFTVARPVKAEYKWLASGKLIPVLEVETQLINNAEVVTNVIYQDSLDNNLFQVGITPVSADDHFNVFPVPANGEIHISTNGKWTNEVLFQLFDANGFLVMNKLRHELGGAGSEVIINTSELANGIYFIRIMSGSEVAVRKVLISK